MKPLPDLTVAPGLGNQDGIANGIKDIAKDNKRGADDWLLQINAWKTFLKTLPSNMLTVMPGLIPGITTAALIALTPSCAALMSSTIETARI